MNLALLPCSVLFAIPLLGQERGTRMLSQPALSDAHVAFVYAEDLWVTDRKGGDARRLTTHKGAEINPRFSPDGKWIAFTGQYDGNRDVYLISVEGGEPRRLTWHPGMDLVQGFTPDGGSVLFTSGRATHTTRHTQLFTVSIEGGHASRLPLPFAFKATISPDGRHIAYVPLREAFRQWKNYRGGTVTRIWVVDTSDHSVVKIPQPLGRCNDTDPMYIGDKIYFRSDRNGEFNLFVFDPANRTVEQVTKHSDFPIVECSGTRDAIVYEQTGYLHVFDPENGVPQQLEIRAAADLRETRPRYASGANFIRDAGLSATGKRAVFAFRGEIVTVPAKKGDVRYLTRTPGAHERSPVWSPDGMKIAYLSDSSGEYELMVANQSGSGAPQRFALGGAGHYEDLKWSPDGRWISFTDNSWSLFVVELSSGKVRKISSEHVYGPVKTLHHSWSPDSKWLAHTRVTESYMQRVYIYSLAEDRSQPVSDGLSDVAEPEFDRSGKYLYFLASTDAGPVRAWFAQSNADARSSYSVYFAVLSEGEPSPLARESDEEVAPEPGETGEKKKAIADAAAKRADPAAPIDFDGIDQRILALPLRPGSYRNLRTGTAGNLYYLKVATNTGGRRGARGSADLMHFDLKKRKEATVAKGVRSFSMSADGKKALVRSGSSWSIITPKPGVSLTAAKIATDRIRVRIRPRDEWRQIFREAWRINRDYFYDPTMHGADWPAMREKYSVFLASLASRSDLNRVIRWMCSELAVGHHRVSGGDRLERASSVPVGLLGADYEIAGGRYRFKRVFGGLNWNPNLRSPLTEPGVGVRAGEYLLRVDGETLRPPENLFSRFENTVGQTVELTVGPNADGTGSRTVKVVPISSEGGLRNRAWIEDNIAKVDKATGGRVAYVYVPNTAGAGHTYFKRYFFPQAHKQAIIVDERYNGGGQVADYYIDILRRPHVSNWAMRYGADIKTPLASIQGPKVMLIDETAGSGGDLLPWMFRKFGLGPLIGKRTWGGLVGTLGFPVLMDGGSVTAPNLAFYDEKGFGVENVGVPPDIEVDQTPKDFVEGRDAQLDRAIAEVLELLSKQPPKKLERPDFPVRVRR